MPCAESIGSVLIWRGARIVPNPQRLDGADMLRVGTTRAPLASLKFKFGHYQSILSIAQQKLTIHKAALAFKPRIVKNFTN
jgi:hypothetical protein